MCGNKQICMYLLIFAKGNMGRMKVVMYKGCVCMWRGG